MPSTYAHYRFGRDVLPKLPAHIRMIILQENDLFNIGLHGPDLLFYYHPLSSNPVNSKGYKIHAEPGITLFRSAAKVVQHSSFSKAYLLKYAEDNPESCIAVKAGACTRGTRAVLKQVALKLNVPVNQSIDDMYMSIEAKLHDGMLIIVDEAQNLSFNAIEALRQV